jgi:hypothetical protein
MHNSLPRQFAVEFVNPPRLGKKGLERLLREFRLNLKRLVGRPHGRKLLQERQGLFDRFPGIGAIGIGDRCNADRDGLGRDGRNNRDDISRGSFKWRDVDRRDWCADLASPCAGWTSRSIYSHPHSTLVSLQISNMNPAASLRPVCAGFAVVPCSSRDGHVATFGRMNSSGHRASLSEFGHPSRTWPSQSIDNFIGKAE